MRITASSGSASSRASDSHRFWLSEEGELGVQLVAVLVAEVARERLQLRVHLAEQHRLAAPAGGERAQAAQEAVRVALHPLLHALGLEQERHGVHAKARDAELQPEADDLGGSRR